MVLFVGFIAGGSAKNNTAMLAAMSLIGFVSERSITTGPTLIILKGSWKCSGNNIYSLFD